jgi:predicted tellurium resistance membrane protein TerC
MGVAAGVLARLLQRYRWIAWIGLAMVLYVSVEMIFRGWHEVAGHVPSWEAAMRWIHVFLTVQFRR